MTFLIIEYFKPGKRADLYRTFDQVGRQLPDGVNYVDSWVNKKLDTCYQIMEADSRSKILEWTNLWTEYAEFEIIEVISSSEAKTRILG